MAVAAARSIWQERAAQHVPVRGLERDAMSNVVQISLAQGGGGATGKAVVSARRGSKESRATCAGCSSSGRSVKTDAIGRRTVAARAFVTLTDNAGVWLATWGRTAAYAKGATTERAARRCAIRWSHVLEATATAMATVSAYVMRDGQGMIAVCVLALALIAMQVANGTRLALRMVDVTWTVPATVTRRFRSVCVRYVLRRAVVADAHGLDIDINACGCLTRAPRAHSVRLIGLDQNVMSYASTRRTAAGMGVVLEKASACATRAIPAPIVAFAQPAFKAVITAGNARSHAGGTRRAIKGAGAVSAGVNASMAGQELTAYRGRRMCLRGVMPT